METISSVNASAQKKTNKRFYALALITFILTLANGDRATLSVAGPEMQTDLGITQVDIGWLFSAFGWSYVIAMPFAGWLSDKIGTKKSLFWAILLWSLGTFLMGFASYTAYAFAVLLSLRLLLGMAESPVGPNAGRIISSWFPSSERGVAGAIYNCAQYLSIAVFTPLMAWLCHIYGWEHVFWVMGAIGLIVAFVWLKTFYVPSKHPSINQAEFEYIKSGEGLVELDTGAPAQKTKSKEADKVLERIGNVLRSRMLCGIFIGQYCSSSMTYFFMTWFPIYLVQARGFSILNAGFVAMLPAICGMIGGVSSGFISDGILKKTNNLSLARKLPITLGMFLSSAIILCNYTDSSQLVIILMCMAFFGKGFGSLGWAVISDTAPKQIVGTTSGLFNALGNISAIITPLVIGYILDATGSFSWALIFVGSHGLVALFSYWVIVGKIERLKIA